MITETLTSPSKATHQFRRVAILFAGGPAPGANAVISTAAISFLKSGCEVLGMKHGYSSLIDYSPEKPLEEGRDWVHLTPEFMKRSRSSQGILIGTARANPGKQVSSPEHLDDPDRAAP
ncbi:MAG: 6-phosphofructokinase, partial [Pirellulales bacterium]